MPVCFSNKPILFFVFFFFAGYEKTHMESADIADLENWEVSERHKILSPTPDISVIKYLN